MLSLLLWVNIASAQYVFILDALHSDSVALYSYSTKPNKDNVLKFEKTEGYLPNGTLVTINGGEDSIKKSVLNTTVAKDYWEDFMVVNYEGQKYYVSTEDLVMSADDNPGVKDFVNKEKNQHTAMGHFYNSPTPYLIALVLLAFAILCALFVRAEWGLRIGFVAAVPVLLLLVVAIEVVGIVSVGTNMLWWLNPKLYGLGTSVFRFILFAAAIVMQVFSMNLYMRGLVDPNDDSELNFKRPIYAALGGAVAFIVVIFICGVTNWNSDVAAWVAVLAFVIITGIGIFSSAKQNVEALGLAAGILFSLFAVIYAVGLVVAIILLIIGFINAFLEMILTVVGAAVAMVVMSKFMPTRTYYRSDGTKVEVYER